MNIISFTLACLLALIHIIAYKWSFFTAMPRSIWLSLGGGISVSYVFLRILPELHQSQNLITEDQALGRGDYHIFLITLIGLIIFYGLERFARESRRSRGSENSANARVFWLHLGSFAVYNMMLGYLLHSKENQDLQRVLFFFFAIAAHFLVNDFGLQQTYPALYVKKGRWLLATSILLGWILGILVRVDEIPLMIFTAIISGGIILNVLKEELPEERQSRFWAFLLGSLLYSSALLLM